MNDGSSALSPYGERALEVVREVAEHALKTGRARLDFEDDLINLRPLDPQACPVSVDAYSGQIDMFVGPEGDAWTHELWKREESERLRELRLCVQAVVTGNYEGGLKTEKARFLWWRWEDVEFRGTFHTEEGVITFGHHGLGPQRTAGCSAYHRFAPY
jgi:hypothetical protein